MFICDSRAHVCVCVFSVDFPSEGMKSFREMSVHGFLLVCA